MNDKADNGARGGDIDFESLERELLKSVETLEDRRLAARIRRDADRISSMILYSDMPKVDIEIAVRSFRREVLELFCDKAQLFDNLYLSRFKRLWQQFRNEGGELMD
ncbi:hypothetical protein DRQ05_02885 [bacterium]|nr:MAG: hypothetical protein DRQ05_02885 [bacterium]